MGIMRSIFFLTHKVFSRSAGLVMDISSEKLAKYFQVVGEMKKGKLCSAFSSPLNASSFFYGSSLIVVNPTVSAGFCSVLLSRE